MEETKKRSYKADFESEKKKNEELVNDLKRLQADFENYKKRVEKEALEFQKLSNHKLMEKLLPILDDFDNTLTHLLKHAKEDTNIQGVKILYDKFKKILFDEGLIPIKSVGEKFDPYRHEVIKKEFHDKEEGIILEEIQKGYMFTDKVIRSSKVKISGGQEIKQQDQEQKSDSHN
ncbi:MAG TPA: nucleotide exchange factor GrpE [Candidatus Nanoarchaeia archaeon]|nr:nucleotide exchange factor GrpE [Candidatus Nanoarchaeia archaeon]